MKILNIQYLNPINIIFMISRTFKHQFFDFLLRFLRDFLINPAVALNLLHQFAFLNIFSTSLKELELILQNEIDL
jgi:hypothetical protein